MFLADTLTLDAPKRTKEGFLAVRAKAARAGVYDYRGCEIDPEGKHFAADQTVKVYRSEAEVFAKDAVRSFLLRPVTDNHPRVPVNADNWTQHAKGVTAGAMKDGEYLAFDLVLMDAGIIAAVDSGKRELSNGYQSEIVIGDGVAPDGTAYQARQTNIRGNHVAVVDKGRAGPECRIGDVAVCDSIDADVLDRLLHDGQTYRGDKDGGNFRTDRSDANKSQSGAVRQEGSDLMATKTITFDGMPIEATDQAEAAIIKLQGQIKDASDAKAKAETDLATAVADKATLEAEKVALTKKLEDSKVTPAQLRDAAKAYQDVVDKAKALKVDVADDMDGPAVMKAVVDAKVGDAAKDWTDVQIAAAFAALTKDTITSDQPDELRGAIRDSAGSQTADKEVKDAYSKMVQDMAEASKPKQLQTA